MGDPKFPQLAQYTNRMTWVLSQGKPMAQVGVYVPTMSMWMGDNSGNQKMLDIAAELLASQHDFDFVDEQSLASMMKLEGGAFTNASGQTYRAIVIPGASVISRVSLDRLQTFAKAGGKVIITGSDPSLVVDKTFLDAKAPDDLSWAIRGKMIESLPKSDVALSPAAPAVKVMHRKWRDADVYFAFNESDQPQTLTASLAGQGAAQVWNAWDASIKPADGVKAEGGTVTLPLSLEGHGAKLIVIGAPTVAGL
jgi:hypothetical protein